MRLNAADFAKRIHGAKQSAGQWAGRCPGHDDHKPSLAWADGEKGLLITCHEGCSLEEILGALDLGVADLFSGEGAGLKIAAIYRYTDEHGNPAYEVVRYADKTFKHRRPNDRGGYIWNVQGLRRLPYRLPDIQGQKIVAVVEGEKDVDTLLLLGIPATTNSGGAGKWTDDHTALLVAAGVQEILLFRDNDKTGEAHSLGVAGSCLKAGLRVKRIYLPGLPPIHEKHGEDVTDWLATEHTKDELLEVLRLAPEVTQANPASSRSKAEAPVSVGEDPWAAAQAVSAFLSRKDKETTWLEWPLLAPGAITELFSPRGIGKTHVAHAIGVKLAKLGFRVLLVDRDNSPGEVRRRLHGWGAADAATFKVMTRDQVPPLTNPSAWAAFPAADYDLVIVDALDSIAEGIGEKDSAKPSKALKPILDLAHREDGPAIMILGNTVRSGQHSRGSGVIEDRADICFEVRDATGFQPSGTNDWCLELPPADAGAWGQRSSRRKRRDSYRLAFIPTKFRIGEEPDPFMLEINLSTDPWALRDVTSEIVEGGCRYGSKRSRPTSSGRPTPPTHSAPKYAAGQKRAKRQC